MRPRARVEARSPHPRRSRGTKVLLRGAELLALAHVEERAERRVELGEARTRDKVALETRGEAARARIRDAIALSFGRLGVVHERDVVVETLAEPTARAFVECGDRRREHDVLVDLRLHLELEL